MKINLNTDEKLDVQMSPLIDCVFLLLIFFLVTTMMKKWEMQIPIELPSITSSLSTTKQDDAPVILSVDEKGRIFNVVRHDVYSGESRYVPVTDIDGFLSGLRSELGTDANIEITAFRTVPVETVITVFDKCQIQGFTHTRVRLGGKAI